MNKGSRIWLMIFTTIIHINGNKGAMDVKLATSDFVDISNSDLFVDKSLFIRAVFGGKIVLITAPRRFGKSTNMNMLKSFVEIEVDKNGRPIPNSKGEETKNCKFFKDRKLNIYKSNKKFFYDNCGAHPVIYVNFKNLPVTDYECFMSAFRTLLNEVFKRYSYLVEETDGGEWVWSNNRTLPKVSIERFLGYYEHHEILKLNPGKVSNGLKYLSEVLYEYFGKKVFIFIDKYDEPIFKTIYSTSFGIERIFNFIGATISKLFKSNPAVERGLINACVQLASVLCPQANNIITYEFLGHHCLSEFYGFTTADIKKLIPNKREREDIDLWYGGYTVFGKEEVKIYSPWSVANYLKFGRLDVYWVGTVYFKTLLSHQNIREKVDAMLNGSAVYIHLNELRNINDLYNLKFIIQHHENNEIIAKYTDIFFKFFCECGYFDVARKNTEVSISLVEEIRIPNVEIRKFFQRHLYGSD